MQWLRIRLALTGHRDLLRIHYITSCEDGSQLLAGPAVEQQAAALSLLGLSRQQQQRLADGYVVFQGLLKRVIQEMISSTALLEVEPAHNIAAQPRAVMEVAAAAAALHSSRRGLLEQTRQLLCWTQQQRMQRADGTCTSRSSQRAWQLC
jgi:hypothetical protein